MSIAEKLTTIAENQQKVYDAGYSAGQAQGGGGSYDQGYEEGKRAEYDRFWDAYQQNGNKTDYIYAFAGGSWNKENFRPKYDMRARTYNCCFHSLNRNDPDWESFDFVEHLENLGVEWDTSKATNFSSCFMWAWIGRLGVIDFTSVTDSLSSTFAYGKIKTIDKLIVKPELDLTYTFTSQAELVNITFEGTIGSNIDFKSCTKLSKESIRSIIDHLSATATGKTLTLSRTAVDNAFGDGSEFSGTDGPEWGGLIETRANWTIALV